MMMMRLTIEVPTMESSTRAKMSWGMAISTSTARPSTWSTQPPRVAESSPSVPPIRKAKMVVRKAMPTVLRAPKMRRESMSRPS